MYFGQVQTKNSREYLQSGDCLHMGNTSTLRYLIYMCNVSISTKAGQRIILIYVDMEGHLCKILALNRWIN